MICAVDAQGISAACRPRAAAQKHLATTVDKTLRTTRALYLMRPRQPESAHTMDTIGPYTDLTEIGKGGMGVVYKANNADSMLAPVVAVKVMFADFTDDERRRFLREARVAHKLRHENIVTVLDLKEAIVRDGPDTREIPYIVMEYLSGADLKCRLAERNFDSLEERIDLMIGVARGLAFAHEKGIVHRDIKPSNIQVTDDGLPKILDFGVARTAGSDLTSSGMQPGTPNYMSPEQVQGKEVDQRSDVFSAGAVFYELLTYRQAFDGDLGEVVHKVLTAEPPRIESVARFVPRELDDLIHAMMEKGARRRPQTMREVVDQLEAVRRSIPDRFGAIRRQTIEYLERISELKERHQDLLEPSTFDDAESTLLVSTKVSIDPSEEATLVISVSQPSYIEAWNNNEQARIDLERLQAHVGELLGFPKVEAGRFEIEPELASAPARPTEVSIELEPPEQLESSHREGHTDKSGAALIGAAALDAVRVTGEFVIHRSKKTVAAARRVIGTVRK